MIDIVTNIIAQAIPSTLSEEEGQTLLLNLQTSAAGHFDNSKRELTQGIVCLDQIRQHRLFTYSGARSWGYWLREFLDENGISKSLAYDLLRVARIWAGGMNLPIEKLLDYGVYPVKSVIEDVVKEYDRATGEIKQISVGALSHLPSGDEPVGERLGQWILETIEAGTPTSVVRDETNKLTDKPKVLFSAAYDNNGTLVDLGWHITFPGGDEDGGYGLETMLPVVVEELKKRLRIKG